MALAWGFVMAHHQLALNASSADQDLMLKYVASGQSPLYANSLTIFLEYRNNITWHI